MPRRRFPTLVAFIFLSGAALAASSPERLCNPLSLPDYPVGRLVRTVAPGKPNEPAGLWLAEKTEQYRELAEPTALWWRTIRC